MNLSEFQVDVSAAELASRRKAMEAKSKDAWQLAQPRPRRVTAALKADPLLATSVDRGAVRNLELLESKISSDYWRSSLTLAISP